ncbi:hypothetical protein Ga0100231_016135 [Opitutaceae bacterium TAV4]|nr:hypothetical protein Ga0100231_016135 [Opitutaceae bacterium TAV4]
MKARSLSCTSRAASTNPASSSAKKAFAWPVTRTRKCFTTCSTRLERRWFVSSKPSHAKCPLTSFPCTTTWRAKAVPCLVPRTSGSSWFPTTDAVGMSPRRAALAFFSRIPMAISTPSSMLSWKAASTASIQWNPPPAWTSLQRAKKYGRRLMHMGGIDKHVLRQTPEAIRRELDYKLQPLMRAGGMVFGLDHRIPNGTPLANYRYYVKTAREILGLDASPPPGWARAAF